METSIDLCGIDMNYGRNIAIYTQLVRFQLEAFSEDTIFVQPDRAQQRTIHELAYRLGLEFEYSLGTRSARVTRPSLPTMPSIAGENDFNTFPSERPRMDYPVDDIGGKTTESSSPGESYVPGGTTPSDFKYPELPSMRESNSTLSACPEPVRRQEIPPAQESKPGPFPRYEYPIVAASDCLKPSFDDARDAIGPSSARHTPLSLGWSKNSKLSNLYNFTVQKGKEPHFELCPPWPATAQTPSRVYLDHESTPQKGEFPCQYPGGCSSKHNFFSRAADLAKHYKNVHATEMKDSFPYDYFQCSRASDPFLQQDHYRDHLRDWHKEPLGRAKGEKKLVARKVWIDERKYNSKWWRCARCLVRINIEESGYECLTCKFFCEDDHVKGIEACRLNHTDAGQVGMSGRVDLLYDPVMLQVVTMNAG